jgi:hypothetical protein
MGNRHCEERSDEAIHLGEGSGATGLLRFARNDDYCAGGGGA